MGLNWYSDGKTSGLINTNYSTGDPKIGMFFPGTIKTWRPSLEEALRFYKQDPTKTEIIRIIGMALEHFNIPLEGDRNEVLQREEETSKPNWSSIQVLPP